MLLSCVFLVLLSNVVARLNLLSRRDVMSRWNLFILKDLDEDSCLLLTHVDTALRNNDNMFRQVRSLVHTGQRGRRVPLRNSEGHIALDCREHRSCPHLYPDSRRCEPCGLCACLGPPSVTRIFFSCPSSVVFNYREESLQSHICSQHNIP